MKNSPKWQDWLLAAPIPILLIIISMLWVSESTTVYESRILLITSNAIFSAASSLLLLLLISRSFILFGAPELLVFGCGILMWGAAGTVAPVMSIHGWNVTISIHNILVWFSSLCQLTGVLISLKNRFLREKRWKYLLSAYVSVFGLIWLVVVGVLHGVVPTFFVQGEGGTLLRQVILSITILTFVTAAIILMNFHRQKPTAFIRWYSMSLLMISTGLLGIFLQSMHGTILNWTARIAQLLGGGYMLVAAFVYLRSQNEREIPLSFNELWQENEFLNRLRQQSLGGIVLRYGLAIVTVLISVFGRIALESWTGHGLPPYLTFYPAIMFVAILAGLGPGVTATIFSSLLAAYWLLLPKGFGVLSSVDRLGLLIFMSMGIAMSIVAELYRHNRDLVAVSEQKKALHESQARLATFAKATFEGIVESEAGRIIDCNEQLSLMLGYSVEELSGMEVSSLIAPEDRERVVSMLLQGKESVVEHSLLRKDGNRIVVEAHGRPVFLGSGRRHTAIRDITGRKIVEEALRQSEELNRNTLQALPAHIAVIDRTGTIISINDSWLEFALDNGVETTSEVIPGANYLEICRIAADQNDSYALKALDGIESVLIGQLKRFAMEYPCHSPQLQRWFHMTVVPYSSGSGAVVIHSNITEQKLVEQAIHQAKEEWERTFDSVPDLIAILDKKDCIARVNKAMADRMEKSPQQCIGLSCNSVISSVGLPPEFSSHSFSHLDSNGREFNVSESTQDSNFLVTTTPLFDNNHNIYATVHVARDITQLKIVESALREHQEQLSLFIEHAPVALAMFDREMHYLFVSKRWLSDYGLELENVIGRSHYDCFPELSEDWKNAHLKGLSGEVLKAEMERLERSDGSVKWIRWEIRPWFEASGDVGGIVLFTEDITERKIAEVKLRESEEILRFHIENSPLAVILWDKDFIVRRWTGKAEQMFGWSASETIGKAIAELNMIYEDDVHIVERTVAQLQEGASNQVVATNRNYTKNGTVRHCTWYNSVLTDQNGQMISVLSKIIDITDLKAAEDALIVAKDDLEKRVIERTEALTKTVEALLNETTERIQAVETLHSQERMLIQQSRQAAMGEMIGNIAHQWRQPLNTLGLFTQRLGFFYGSPEFTKEFLDESVSKSMEIIQYMSRTIDDFRNFFITEQEKSEFSAEDAVHKALTLVEASFKESKIEIDLQVSNQAKIFGFPNEYAQVLLNIMINAKDAILDRNIQSPVVRITISTEGNATVVTIADNAGGISDDIIENVFEPYFTTKGPQQGTGVGLFMSKTIIETKMCGCLTVSNTGEGAEFRIKV